MLCKSVKWRGVCGTEESREEGSDWCKCSGCRVVNCTATALEKWQDVCFVLSEKFSSRVKRLGAE